MTLPNFITIARIFMVPAIVWLLFAEAYQPAFFLFLLAGLSDALDGFVAKQFNQRSELGAYLDPAGRQGHARRHLRPARHLRPSAELACDTCGQPRCRYRWRGHAGVVAGQANEDGAEHAVQGQHHNADLLVALVLGGLAIGPIPQISWPQ
jgi:hypothetical protein